MPFSRALDVVYALALDDMGGSRIQAREALDQELARPFDREEAEQFDRDNWGMSPEAVRIAMTQDAALADVTYG